MSEEVVTRLARLRHRLRRAGNGPATEPARYQNGSLLQLRGHRSGIDGQPRRWTIGETGRRFREEARPEGRGLARETETLKGRTTTFESAAETAERGAKMFGSTRVRSTRTRLVSTVLAILVTTSALAGPAAAAGERWTPQGTESMGWTCTIFGCYLFLSSPTTQSVAAQLASYGGDALVARNLPFPIRVAMGYAFKLIPYWMRHADRGCGVILYIWVGGYFVQPQRC